MILLLNCNENQQKILTPVELSQNGDLVEHQINNENSRKNKVKPKFEFDSYNSSIVFEREKNSLSKVFSRKGGNSSDLHFLFKF